MIEAWRRWRTLRRWQARERALGALALASRRGDPEMADWPLMHATGLSGTRLYAALEELERIGEITARRGEPTPNGGCRRHYRLAEREG